jgi:pimeloyl-ACP methyl ester carboxylesterase
MNSRIVAVNGINLHVVDLGNGPAVFLCHGFPDGVDQTLRFLQN